VTPSSAPAAYLWPASNEYAVAVGGTMFRHGVERYWSSRGAGGTLWAGGYGYTDYPMARWQADEWVRLGLLHSALDALIPGYVHRYIPDVSFVAEQVAIVFAGAPAVVSGTSVGAPCWAGIWALVEERYQAIQGVGLAQPAPDVLYTVAADASLAPAFLDQVAGQAAPFDARIGLGPPDVYDLVTDVPQVF
jgi:subtilase family serine protease